MLDTIHNQGIRICLGAFRTSLVESLYVAANEESLYRRRDRLSIQYALKIKSTPKNPVYIYFILNVFSYLQIARRQYQHLVFVLATC